MARQIILILLGSLLLVAEGRADVRKEVEKAKQVLQAAFNSRDANVIQQRTTADHLSITTRFQFFSQADQLKTLSDYKVSSYEMAGLQVIPLTKDVVLLTYRADIEGAFRGKQLPSKVRVVETWVRRDGKWLQASYQSTPVGDSKPGISALTAAGEDRLPQPQYKQTKQVIALVEKAAEVLKREGPQAFSKFRQKNSEWFHGDSYVFVHDRKGVCLCHPFQPALEGTNLIDLKDVDGKRLTAMMIDTLSGQRAAGWVHYKWPRPEDATPSWKSSYVVRVKDSSGNEYLLGSGMYGMKVEKLFIVETVDEAARLIGKNGKKAFPILRDKAGRFRYMDVYVFVGDQKGNELVSAGFPELEGTNLWDFKDANGKLVIQNQIQMLETKDAGWNDYMWAKPGETKPSQKLSYVRKVKSTDGFLYVGAGLYAE